MSENVVLVDSDGKQLLVITTSENVFVSQDKTLKQYLEEMQSGGGGGSTQIIVDKELSILSTNPVENKAIAKRFNELENIINNIQPTPARSDMIISKYNANITLISGEIVDTNATAVTMELSEESEEELNG